MKGKNTEERDAKLEQEETVTGKGESRRFQKHAKPNWYCKGMWMQKGAQQMYVLTYGLELITWK